MKKGFFQLLIGILYSLPLFGAQLNLINFEQEGEVSKLVLSLDRGDVQAKRFHVKDDKQILLDLQNVEASPRVLRAFDTSEFSGAVVFVTGYKKPNTKSDLRLAVQLRDNVRSYIQRKENQIILLIENRFGAFSKAEFDINRSKEDLQAGKLLKNVNIPKSTSLEDILENLTLSGQKKYVGKRISFNVKNVSFFIKI